LRVAFAGTPAFACPTLAALLAQHELVGVLTQPDRPRGRGLKSGASAVKLLALEHRLPLLQPTSLKDPAVLSSLEAWRPEVLVVIAYGLLLPSPLLTLPRYGCLNVHASLLPRWRGAAPIQRALLAGDAQSGVSIMQMDAGLDTGAVWLERPYPIAPGETGGSLHDALAALGARAILEALEGIAGGTLHPRAQDPAGVTYAAKIDKAEARLDWSAEAVALERQVRAFHPRPVAETVFEGRQLRVHAADVVEKETLKAAKNHDPGTIVGQNADLILVSCGSGVLGLRRLQLPGRNPISAREFAQGRSLLGQRLG
jgi:methionyl-tRNA formyltransferase